VIDRLNAEITRALYQADVREALSRYALVPAPVTPRELRGVHSRGDGAQRPDHQKGRI
jgi:hypothetical protein